MNRALLVGRQPPRELGYTYVTDTPYDAVVIGSLELNEALYFKNAYALQALAEGKPVILYTPGLPDAPKNRALAASLASARRQMKSWGVLFTDGAQKRLITAQEARALQLSGKSPEAGAVLTPLAKEILGGAQ